MSNHWGQPIGHGHPPAQGIVSLEAPRVSVMTWETARPRGLHMLTVRSLEFSPTTLRTITRTPLSRNSMHPHQHSANLNTLRTRARTTSSQKREDPRQESPYPTLSCPASIPSHRPQPQHQKSRQQRERLSFPSKLCIIASQNLARFATPLMAIAEPTRTATRLKQNSTWLCIVCSTLTRQRI